MNDKRFVLVTEDKPNSFEPIYWSQNDLYDLKSIDKYTSMYDKEDFNNMLSNNNLVSDKEHNYAIIYNDKGIRKLKDGVLFKNDYINDFYVYISEFLKKNKNNSQLLNNIYQKLQSDKLISNSAKRILYVIFINRSVEDKIFNAILNDLNELSYVDLRIMYVCIFKNTELLNNKKLKLNKGEDEK